MDESQLTNRCPMCGKENAPDVERCTFCHAALKAFNAEPKPAETSAEDDWLNNLRAGNGLDNSVKQAEYSEEQKSTDNLSQEEDEDASDWLQRIGQGGDEDQLENPQPSESESVQPSGDNQADFLSGLRESAAIEGEETLSEDVSDDWLEKLRLPTQENVLPESADILESSEADAAALFGEEEDNLIRLDSLSSWQSRLSLEDQEGTAEDDTSPLEPHSSAEEEAEIGNGAENTFANAADQIPSESSSQESMEVPSWLEDLQNSAFPAQPVDFSKESVPVPDWLQGLVSEESAPEQPIESQETSQPEESYQTEEDDFQPDWLRALRSDTGSRESASALNEDTPSDLPQKTGNEIEQLAEDTQGSTFSLDREDDLSELRNGNAQEPFGETELAGELPDWLKDFASESGQEGLTLAGLEETDSKLEKSEPSEEMFSPAESLSDEEQPGFSEEPSLILEDENENAAPEPAEILSELGEFEYVPREETVEQEGEIPYWLTALQPEEAEDTAEAALPFEESELPDWMKPEPVHDEPEIPAFLPDFEIDRHNSAIQNSDTMPFEAGELPTWLDEVSEPLEKTSSRDVLNSHEDIAPAELPSWLKEMKPRSAPNQSFAELNVFQQIGPLAGMQEVLPTSEQNRTFPANLAQAGKLLVSDEQLKSAEIISTLLDKMSDSAKLSSPGDIKVNRWIKPAISLILMLAILIPLLSGNRANAEPSEMTGPGMQAYSAVQNLADDSPVLLAFDFEPAYSGELSYGGKAMLQQLLQKNVRLVFVSTNAAGPVLAETFLQETLNSLTPEWTTEAVVNFQMRNVANLGYLAGGTASLQEFVRNPQQATRFGLKAAMDGVSTWSLPALNNLDSVDDYALVVVLTDSSETGRAWVEQVQPHLNGHPLIMVSSSVAAPMLMPYVESGQIDGLVAGMTGGYKYQAKVGQGNYHGNADAALKAASLVVILFLSAGLIFFGIQNRRSNRFKE